MPELTAFLDRHGERAVGALLADVGVTEELVRRELRAATGPGVARAAMSGFLEERIREHLRPFYAAYPFPPEQQPAARRGRGERAGA